MSNSTIIRQPNASKFGQSVMTELTSSQAQSVTSVTWATISDGTTNFSVTITPTLNTSKVLLIIDFSGACTNDFYWKIQRNGSDCNVGTGATGSQINATGGGCGNAATAYIYSCFKYIYLDSPASTSAQTYTIQIYPISTGTLWVNRSGTDTNSSACYRYTSRLIAIEVLA
jgi:hypothetical protein